MDDIKKESKSLMEGVLGNVKLSRRSFIKAWAVTGAAVAAGTGLKPELKALAASDGSATTGMGSGCRPPARGARPGAPNRCM